jgi:hypothetical protein
LVPWASMRCPGTFTRLTTLVLALSLFDIAQGGYESNECSDSEDEGYYSCLSDEEADPNTAIGLDSRCLAFLNYVAEKLEKQLQTADLDSKDLYTRLMLIEAIQRNAETLITCIGDIQPGPEQNAAAQRFKALGENANLAQQCPICCEQYHATRFPCISNCKHIVCSNCVMDKSVKASCPVCRDPTPWWDLKLGIALLTILKETLSDARLLQLLPQEAHLRDFNEYAHDAYLDLQRKHRTELELDRCLAELAQEGTPSNTALLDKMFRWRMKTSWNWWAICTLNRVSTRLGEALHMHQITQWLLQRLLGPPQE